MASDRDNFSISGPSHLTSICWDNSYHRTAVASSLVKGVSTMQRDMAEERESPLAKPWWESFGFSLVDEPLINEADDTIYGAVFEYNKNTSHLGGKPPRYVIAFRGTILSSDTWFSDVQQDLRCFLNNLNGSRRLKHAIQAIETVLAKHKSGTTSIWLAGHSLGASIALLAGKAMARSGFLIETYAFNPLHSSLPLEQLCDSEKFKGKVRMAKSIFKTSVALLFDLQIQEDGPRTAVWTPYLYVNPVDLFSSEYIGDFKHKKFMANIGASKIESVGARISFRSQIFGGGTSSSPSDLPVEPIQLLSSADMTVNMNETANIKTAHGIKQWWEPNSALRENWEFHSIRPSI